jgi:hypothetical protein
MENGLPAVIAVVVRMMTVLLMAFLSMLPSSVPGLASPHLVDVARVCLPTAAASELPTAQNVAERALDVPVHDVPTVRRVGAVEHLAGLMGIPPSAVQGCVAANGAARTARSPGEGMPQHSEAPQLRMSLRANWR